MIAVIYKWLVGLFADPEERNEYSQGRWQHMIRQEALRISQSLAGSGRILEVGCGEGLFLRQLSLCNPNRELWGVDNDDRILRLARNRFIGNRQIRLLREDATRLSFQDDYFDMVICVNVLYNLRSLEEVRLMLSEMKRVTKKGGRIIFDFRNHRNPLLRLKYRLAPYYDPSIRNIALRTYTCEQMESLLKAAGLILIRKIYMSMLLKRYAPFIIIEAQKPC